MNSISDFAHLRFFSLNIFPDLVNDFENFNHGGSFFLSFSFGVSFSSITNPLNFLDLNDTNPAKDIASFLDLKGLYILGMVLPLVKNFILNPFCDFGSNEILFENPCDVGNVNFLLGLVLSSIIFFGGVCLGVNLGVSFGFGVGVNFGLVTVIVYGITGFGSGGFGFGSGDVNSLICICSDDNSEYISCDGFNESSEDCFVDCLVEISEDNPFVNPNSSANGFLNDNFCDGFNES